MNLSSQVKREEEDFQKRELRTLGKGINRHESWANKPFAFACFIRAYTLGGSFHGAATLYRDVKPFSSSPPPPPAPVRTRRTLSRRCRDARSMA